MTILASPVTTPPMTTHLPCWTPPTTKKHKTNSKAPFWFGLEDNEHIFEIIKAYGKHLQVNRNRPTNSRAPIQFIGRVERYPLVFERDSFYTIDKVFVCQYSICYWGQVMPCVRTELVKTKWNLIDGIPIKQENTKHDVTNMNSTPSQLYSFPMFDQRGVPQFQFSHGCDYAQDWQVGYADLFNQCLQNTMPLKNHNTVVEEDFSEQDDDDDADYEYDSDSSSDEEETDYSYLLSAPSSGLDSFDFDEQIQDSSSDEDDFDEEFESTSPLRIEITSPYDDYSYNFDTLKDEHVRRQTHSPEVLCQ